jgi:hypothetical protein
MTLPTNIIFPEATENTFQDKEELTRYNKEMTFTLQRMYEDVAYAINGGWRGDKMAVQETWTPAVYGVGTKGAGTYGADTRVGLCYRQGLMVDCWFDVTYSAHTGAGNMYIELPYLVAQSSGKPFVGVLQTATLACTDWLACNAIPNTRRLEIWDVAGGGATTNVAIAAAGQLIGHVRYVGQAEERT